MNPKVPKLVLSNFSKTTAIISALALVFGLFCLCCIPVKQKEYQQAQAQYAIDLETRTREVSVEIDEYIKTGPLSMNDITYTNVTDGELYRIDPISIIGPFATMETSHRFGSLSETIFTTYFYILYYTDSSNEQVGVILESAYDNLALKTFSSTLYVRTDLTPAKSTVRDLDGEYPTSYSILTKIDPYIKCISLHIDYTSRDEFVADQKDRISLLAATSLDRPSDEALNRVKANAKNGFIFAAILIVVTLYNMRLNAAKKRTGNSPAGSI